MTSFSPGDCAAILDRHAVRRAAGVPTVTLLIGPIGAGCRLWRNWAVGAGRRVILANRHQFPHAAWVDAIAEEVDLQAAAIHHLARRAGRDPAELLAAWPSKTRADREWFWSGLAPNTDDDLLRAVADVSDERSSARGGMASLRGLEDRWVLMITRLVSPTIWPSVVFVARSVDDLVAVGSAAADWAIRLPALAISLSVPAGVWNNFVATAMESRAKALLREGGLPVPALDEATVERTLADAGAEASATAAITGIGADAPLLEAAIAAVRATATPPRNLAEDDRARSAAERFLFMFLDFLPETAGRFELNAALDFDFGSRPAEVDLLCRAPPIAIELDGYFHFLAADGYRRDRTKDWELQRRGFVVLRFLAEDVIPRLEMIRDRILDALSTTR